jgi:transforming growth factor-beta-induced protein
MTSRTRLLPALGAVAAAAAITAAPAMAQHSPMPAKPTQNIVQIAASNPQFSTLVSLVKEAGLVKTLSGKGPFTVLAPTNAAFKKVPAATLAALKADPDKLRAVLTYHVIPGKVPASKVVTLNGKSVKTVEGSTVKITVKGKAVKVNNATVTKTDIMATNGVIHVINGVLIPPAK